MVRVIRVPEAVDEKRVNNAVQMGLRWLSKHQDEDGRWDCDDHNKHDAGGRIGGVGAPLYDVGVTALSLLAFLRTGNGDLDGHYNAVVRRGLNFLIESQDDEGCFGARASQHFIYNTVLATWAMVEGFKVTKNPTYAKVAQRGVDYLMKARNPYMGWRYGVRSGENDTSVTSWCMQALKTAEAAGLRVDKDAYKGALQWIDKMTDREFGNVGYNYPGGTSARLEGLQDKFPPQHSAAMTAAGILTRIECGEDARLSASIQKGVTICAGLPPVWDEDAGTIDMYYWYFGTRAMRVAAPNRWKEWKRHMQHAAVSHQHEDGTSAAGSWNPVGAWGTDGGRVYSTALMTLALQATR